MPYALAIDFGTSGCRSAIYDSKLNMICSSVEEYPLIVLSDSEIEQDADLWWSKAKETIRGALKLFPYSSDEISSISISSQGIAFVPIDEFGNTLFNAISWLDTRAKKETDSLAMKYGEELLYEKTGKRLSSLYTLPKLMWFREAHPDLFDKAWKFLLPMDFIQFRLTGKCVTDHTMAGGTMFYNIRKQTWDEELLAQNDIPCDKLPEIKWAGETVEKILPDVADELGLSRNVLIVNGAQDQKCAALGAGVDLRVAAISLGTGSCIAQISSAPVSDPLRRIPFFSYTEAGKYDLEGVINTAGSAYAWFKSGFSGDSSYEELNSAAEEVSIPNSVMFFPYLSGGFSPNWTDGTGTFTGLSLRSTKGHLARAVMEGIAYNIRENLDVMATICGKAQEIRLYGGGSKSDLWCRIIADTTGTPVVRLSSSETALAGAAILAFKPTGVATPCFLPLGDRFEPNEDSCAVYDCSYKLYENTRKKFFG